MLSTVEAQSEPDQGVAWGGLAEQLSWKRDHCAAFTASGCVATAFLSQYSSVGRFSQHTIKTETSNAGCGIGSGCTGRTSAGSAFPLLLWESRLQLDWSVGGPFKNPPCV